MNWKRTVRIRRRWMNRWTSMAQYRVKFIVRLFLDRCVHNRSLEISNCFVRLSLSLLTYLKCIFNLERLIGVCNEHYHVSVFRKDRTCRWGLNVRLFICFFLFLSYKHNNYIYKDIFFPRKICVHTDRDIIHEFFYAVFPSLSLFEHIHRQEKEKLYCMNTEVRDICILQR